MKARLSCMLLLVLAGGCGQRVVDLALPPRDAAAAGSANVEAGTMAPVAMACEDVKRADGTVCKLCFAADGSVINGACEPAKPTSPTAMSPPAADPNLTPWQCKPTSLEPLRCLECVGPMPSYRACLRCEADMATGKPGERCRNCGWNDLPGASCTQCLDVNDAVTYDDCNKIRKETIYDPQP